VLGLSRLIHDLLQWATREFGVLHIDPAFLQISSIMPQKRNPVVLEHLRARIGWVIGDVHTAETLVHSAALGDTVDVEDEFYEPLFRAFEHGIGVLRLLDAALGTCRFDVDLLARRAADGFTTATELADTLVRRWALPFRQAHRVASAVVRRVDADAARVTPEIIADAASDVLGRPIVLSADDLRAALDPWAFVERRTIPGGPAPAAVKAHLADLRERLAADVAWRRARQAQIDAAHAERQRRLAALAALAP
jgi:argininosuccinate lyase